MEKLIPAYEKDWKAYGTTNEEYIRRSSWSKGPEDVKEQLLRYVEEYVDEQETKEFILNLTKDEQLLAKSTVVSDGSYRTIVCHLSATSFYIRGKYDLEKNFPNISISRGEWNQFAMENSEEFFIIFDYQKTRKRLHGIYAPNIMKSSESYTAKYIKDWCEHHKDYFESNSSADAYLLYGRIWGEYAVDGFSPNPKVFYFVEPNFRKGGYMLKRDLQKNPRKVDIKH